MNMKYLYKSQIYVSVRIARCRQRIQRVQNVCWRFQRSLVRCRCTWLHQTGGGDHSSAHEKESTGETFCCQNQEDRSRCWDVWCREKRRCSATTFVQVTLVPAVKIWTRSRNSGDLCPATEVAVLGILSRGALLCLTKRPREGPGIVATWRHR